MCVVAARVITRREGVDKLHTRVTVEGGSERPGVLSVMIMIVMVDCCVLVGAAWGGSNLGLQLQGRAE